MSSGSNSKSFGSFHSENVEEMIRSSDWKAPQLPFSISDLEVFSRSHCQSSCLKQSCNSLFQDKISSEAEFGDDFLSKHFLLDSAWTFVNHGAFGAPLVEAYELAERWRRYAELQPLRFIDRTLFPHIVQVVEASHFMK